MDVRGNKTVCSFVDTAVYCILVIFFTRKKSRIDFVFRKPNNRRGAMGSTTDPCVFGFPAGPA